LLDIFLLCRWENSKKILAKTVRPFLLILLDDDEYLFFMLKYYISQINARNQASFNKEMFYGDCFL